MSSRSIRHLVNLVIGFLCLSGWGVRAGPVQVRSSHEQRQVGDGESFLWLEPHQMMLLKVSGPTHLGLRLRQVLTPGRAPVPVDLTVVRDDAVQGTARFKVSASGGELSKEVLVKIDVPSGRHTYRLLVSGPERGVVLKPFSGSIRPDRQAIVATPGGDRVTEPVRERGPRRKRRKSRPRPLDPEPPELLDPVAAATVARSEPKTYRIEHRPDEGGTWFGPGVRTAGSLGGMFLLGATVMIISSSVQEDRARAERSQNAALVIYSLAGAAIVTAVVFQLIERPTAEPSGGQAPLALLRF